MGLQGKDYSEYAINMLTVSALTLVKTEQQINQKTFTYSVFSSVLGSRFASLFVSY